MYEHIKTGGKLNIDKDKIRDNNSKKMELLQKQFIKKSNELAKKNKDKKSIVKNQQTVAKTSVETDKYKEKYMKVNKSLKEYRNKFKNSEKVNKNLKSLNDEKDEIIKNDKLYIIQLEDKIKELKKDIGVKKDIIDYYENSYYKRTYNILLNEINWLNSNNYKLKLILKSNKSRILAQKYQINRLCKNIKLLKEGFSNTDNKIIIESLNEKVKKLIYKNNELREELKSSEKSTYEKCKKLIDENMKLRQSRGVYKRQYHINSKNRKSKKYVGNLKTVGMFAYFESIFGNRWIANIDSIGKFEEGTPCYAYIRNSGAIADVKGVYSDAEFIKQSDISKKLNANLMDKNAKGQLLLANYNYEYSVLLIGNLSGKDKYTKELNKIKIKADWFDPYRENIVRLREKSKKYDILICFSSNSRHYATDFIKYMILNHGDEVNKYNVLYKAGIKQTVGRIRYCIENM